MKFHVEKSISIDASLDKVRAHVDDFSAWHNWSPWTVCEPDCTIEVHGEVGRVGHCMSWRGEVIGSGTNTIIEVHGDYIRYDLVFHTPWKSQAQPLIHFVEHDGKTIVTWKLDSSMPFFLFFMIDMMKNWIGMDYDRGLRMLKAVVQTGRVPAKTTNKGLLDFKGFNYVGRERTCDFSILAEMMQKDYETIVDDFITTKGKKAQHWLTIYPKVDMKKMRYTYIAALSDEDLGDLDLGSDYVRGTIASSEVLEIYHEGSYEYLGNAWSMGMMYMRAKKMRAAGKPFEYYHNNPQNTASEDLLTSIYFPVR